MTILAGDIKTKRESSTVAIQNACQEAEGPNYFLVGGPSPNYQSPRLQKEADQNE